MVPLRRLIYTNIGAHSRSAEDLRLGTKAAASAEDIVLAEQILAALLTPPTFDIIPEYEINVNYINTKTIDYYKNLSLKFPDDFFDKVCNVTDQKAKGDSQTQTFNI